MLAIPFILASFLAALVVVQRYFREFPPLVRIFGAYAVSIVITGWVAFAFGWLFHALGQSDATFYGSIVAILVNLIIIALGYKELDRRWFRITPIEVVAVGAALAFSFWLMDARLSGDPLTVSANTWGDNALHIGIARSFSQGDNYPPEFPIFSGETIRYHFGMDFYAGALERMGLPIDWAFNVPGALGFAGMMVLVFELGRYLWRRTSIGVLAAILLITNGSLSFLRYFQQYPSVSTALKPDNWWNHNQYLAIAPYEQGEKIALYWTLNVYLTQTHLIVSMALVLFVAFVLIYHLRGRGGTPSDNPDLRETDTRRIELPPERAVALGLMTGGFFWINGVLFVPAMVLFAALFYLYSGQLRRMLVPSLGALGIFAILLLIGSVTGEANVYKLALIFALASLVFLGPIRQSLPFFVVAGVIALPQMVWLNGGLGTETTFTFHTGYLVQNFRFDRLSSYWDFTEYWWLNLGVVLPLVVLAAVIGSKSDRKLLLAFMAVFIFGNFVQLGRDLGGHNHKVFNFWETLINLFAAYAFVSIWDVLAKGIRIQEFRLSPVVGRAVAATVLPVVFLFLVLSGMVDFMTLKNDPRYGVFGDAQPAIDWIEDNTPRDAVFVTAYGDTYTVPTLAGRRVILGGFDPWTVDKGYVVAPRQDLINRIYAAADKATACSLLTTNSIDYVQIGGSELSGSRFPPANQAMYDGTFVKAYPDPTVPSNVSYYDVAASCGTAAVSAQ